MQVACGSQGGRCAPETPCTRSSSLRRLRSHTLSLLVFAPPCPPQRPHIRPRSTSPPPTPLASNTPGNGAIASIAQGPITTGPFLNPHSLAVDELPSPFPLPLTSTHLSHSAGYAYNGGAAGGGNGKRRARGGGREAQAVGGLGKSLALLNTIKDQEVEHDLMEIRRGNKRRRTATTAIGAKS